MESDSPKPALLYDGDCGFCRFWLARWHQRVGDRVEYIPLQDPQVAERFPHLSTAQLTRAVHLVEPDGRVYSGAHAVFRALALGGSRIPVRAYRSVPGFAFVSEAAYRLVADHRPLFSAITTLLWGQSARPDSYGLSSWLFLRLLGLAYLAAFWSLGSQVIGLVGHNGILPADAYMSAARQWADANHLDALNRGFWMPTLFWWGTSDTVLKGACIAGAALASMLIAGIAPAAVLPLLWFLYLSLSAVCRDFLEFQWDMLLLETGLLAIVIAPLTWWARADRAADPPRLARWLLWWLLFRLTLGSGIVKLASGDPTWRGLTALIFHYETQPLPTPVAWYAHQLPVWFQKASTAVVLAIELLTPWLIPTPRRLRTAACLTMISLQVLIALTGNYAFFNLLTIALCILLLDDETLRRGARAWPWTWPQRSPTGVPRPSARHWPRWVPVAAALVTVPISGGILAAQMGFRAPASVVIGPIASVVSPFRSINGYGLFAVMTQTRDEIIVEGSNDRVTWQAYEFKYKPGDLARRPPWVAPHQPRLDWQMWFAALDQFDTQPWLQSFLLRLLQGSPDVLRLVANDPFKGTPPRYIRCEVYRYHFSDITARRSSRVVWTREPLGDYSPVLTLQSAR
jgi:predicted DCC family thiol-disulfide oxidoreductase YuxK